MRSPLRFVCRRLVASGWLLLVALVLGLAQPVTAWAQRSFATPDAAMNAFGDAIASNDEGELKALFGVDFRQLIPPVDDEVRTRFLQEWAKSHAIQAVDDKHAKLAVGDDGWTFPIPLVKDAKGWYFDTRAGADEMRIRRIGRNELATIQTMLAVYDAQREYAQTSHDGNPMLTYAAKLVSSPGKHDGLYWPTDEDQQPSPLGIAFVTATKRKPPAEGYYGYHYKLLTSQGPHAPGGAYDYMVHGKLFGGFAVLAWPVKYRDTGVKSFMVSHDGQVYSRDLGPDGAARAEAMKSFDPDSGWTREAP
jgi:Protein of unknown function (DUF2950)